MKSEEEKLEYCEKKLKQITIDRVNHKLSGEEFTNLFVKYGNLVEYYRHKLNKPPLFHNQNVEDEEENKDELLQLVAAEEEEINT